MPETLDPAAFTTHFASPSSFRQAYIHEGHAGPFVQWAAAAVLNNALRAFCRDLLRG